MRSDTLGVAHGKKSTPRRSLVRIFEVYACVFDEDYSKRRRRTALRKTLESAARERSYQSLRKENE